MELDPRINDSVQHVYNKHHEDEKGTVEYGGPHNNRIIAVIDPGNEVLAHSWNRENLFDNEASCQYIGDQCSEQRDDWQYSIAQRMLDHDRRW